MKHYTKLEFQTPFWVLDALYPVEPEPYCPYANIPKPKPNPLIQKIIDLHEQGYKHKQITEMLGTSYSYINASLKKT